MEYLWNTSGIPMEYLQIQRGSWEDVSEENAVSTMHLYRLYSGFLFRGSPLMD